MRSRKLLACLVVSLLVLARPAWADRSGSPPSEAAPATPIATPAPALTIAAVSPATAEPASGVVQAAPRPDDAPKGAAPYYRKPMFWISIVVGAAAVGAIAWGATWAATYDPPYAVAAF